MSTVIGNGRLHMLPPLRWISRHSRSQDRLCTYESKHDPASKAYNLIRLHLPARITDEEVKTLSKVALAGYRATHCRDYARLDIRRRDGFSISWTSTPTRISVWIPARCWRQNWSVVIPEMFCSWLVSLQPGGIRSLEQLASKKEGAAEYGSAKTCEGFAIRKNLRQEFPF